MRIVHVLNTSSFEHVAALRQAQDITLRSILRARSYAATAGLDVVPVAVCYPDERADLPAAVVERPDLAASVRDHVPTARRRLPLVADLLRHGLAGMDATHVVLTNIDIALVPQFYVAVAAMLAAGDASLVINRRTIPSFEGRRRLPPLEVMASFVGRPHPGRDCFVFPRGATEEFDLGHTVIGARAVGRVLHWNLEAVCGPTTWRKNLHLTFHLGDDQDWREAGHDPINDFNLREATAVYDRLVERHGPLERFPRRPTPPPSDGADAPPQ